MTGSPKQSSSGLGQYLFVGVIVVLLLGGIGYFFGVLDRVRSIGTSPEPRNEVPVDPGPDRSEPGQRLPIAAGSADASDERLVALGKRVYDDQCATCHGAALEGQPNWQVRLPSGLLPAPPHDDSGHTWHHSDATLFAVTKYGIAEFNNLDYESAMPVFKDVLSDEEIWAVLAFIKSHWSERSRQFQERINAQETKRLKGLPYLQRLKFYPAKRLSPRIPCATRR